MPARGGSGAGGEVVWGAAGAGAGVGDGVGVPELPEPDPLLAELPLESLPDPLVIAGAAPEPELEFDPDELLPLPDGAGAAGRADADDAPLSPLSLTATDGAAA